MRPITFETYERLVRVHVIPALGGVKLKAISPAHLQGFYRDRLDAGCPPARYIACTPSYSGHYASRQYKSIAEENREWLGHSFALARYFKVRRSSAT